MALPPGAATSSAQRSGSAARATTPGPAEVTKPTTTHPTTTKPLRMLIIGDPTLSLAPRDAPAAGDGPPRSEAPSRCGTGSVSTRGGRADRAYPGGLAAARIRAH